MFMPQNDHDYHNINAMHVHTKNDQDFDSAIHYRNKRITKRIGPPVTVQWPKTASSRDSTGISI